GTFGTVSPPFDRGRTTTHEVGHWLNLRHIWGDGGCSVDDHVADTPPADRPHHGCVNYAESCGSQNMVQNFMDYTDDACMNLFTKGQSARMRALFAPGGYREALTRSPGLKDPTPAPPPPMVYLSAPKDVEVLTVADRFARLKWSSVQGAERYYVRLRKSGQSRWMAKSFDRPFVNPSQLSTCADYEMQVASIQGRDTSDFSSPVLFSTAGCAIPASQTTVSSSRQPQGLEAIPKSSGQMYLSWDRVAGATEYKVQIKQVGSRVVTTKYLDQPGFYLKDLQAGKRYLYRVRAHFPNQPGPYSDIYPFSYGSLAMANQRRAGAPSQIMQAKFYPEPNILWLKVPVTESQRVDVSILELDGQTLVQQFPRQQATPTRSLRLSPDFLRPGRYLVQVKDEDGFTVRQEMDLE
ncbi:MAG: M43 family zinc metalloprotease, partial [Bacteroidota bacterium]